MKTMYCLLAAMLIYVAGMAQATPHEKAVLKNDIAKERARRHAVAKDVLTGQPARARADHRAAVAYHKKIHRDAKQIHQNDVNRARQRHYARKRVHG
ncbi:MAG TPA: hypothetical protein VL307_03000 [Chitinophagaceae bacterium]|nr:hypothetical protein [Chitinophagaceae bacterium]